MNMHFIIVLIKILTIGTTTGFLIAIRPSWVGNTSTEGVTVSEFFSSRMKQASNRLKW